MPIVQTKSLNLTKLNLFLVMLFAMAALVLTGIQTAQGGEFECPGDFVGDTVVAEGEGPLIPCCWDGFCDDKKPIYDEETPENCPIDCGCGNGEVQTDIGEECDPGMTCPDGSSCKSEWDCIIILVKETDVTADNGMELLCIVRATEDCRDDCTIPVCGDGILDSDEQCDGDEVEECDAGQVCNDNCECETPPDDTPDTPPAQEAPPAVDPPTTFIPADGISGSGPTSCSPSTLVPGVSSHAGLLTWTLINGFFLAWGILPGFIRRRRK